MSTFGIRLPVKTGSVYEYVIERFAQAGLLPEFEGINRSVAEDEKYDEGSYCEEVFTEHLPMKFSFYICDGFFYYGFLSTDHDTAIEVSADDFVELSAMKIALKKFNSDVTFGFFTFRV